jgi:hypothetical protein
MKAFFGISPSNKENGIVPAGSGDCSIGDIVQSIHDVVEKL